MAQKSFQQKIRSKYDDIIIFSGVKIIRVISLNNLYTNLKCLLNSSHPHLLYLILIIIIIAIRLYVGVKDF